MDQLPYDNLEQLSLIVTATYKGGPEEQKKATEIIHEMGKDYLRFTQSMINIITADVPSNEANFNLKRAACVLLPTVITFNEKALLENPKALLNVLLDVFFSDKVQFSLKPSMSPVFMLFYSMDINGELRKEGLTRVKDRLINGGVNEYYAALYILQTIVNCSKLAQKTTANWFQHLLEGLLKSGSTIVNGIILEIQDTIQGGDQATKVNNIFVGATVLKLWTEMVQHFANLLGKNEAQGGLTFKPDFIKFLTIQENILEIFKKTLLLHVPTEKQIAGCLLSTCGVTIVDDQLNAIKTIILEIFNTVLDYMQTYAVLVEDKENNKFYAYIKSEGLKLVLDSTYRFCKSTTIDMDEALDKIHLHGCLVEGLKMMTKLVGRKELWPAFTTFKSQLVMDICLPLIRSSPSELADFKEDPEQFVHLAVDTCQKQDSETQKTQAAQLLEHMCANIDGVLSYTVVMLLQLIDYSLVSNDISEIQEKFKRLIEYRDSNCYFLTKTDSTIRVETCLVVLTNISYLIAARPDLMEIVERVFAGYHEYFLGPKATPYIQCRLCLFLGHFLEHIFKDESKQEIYKLYLGFLVKCAGLTEEEYAAVAEQANQSLCLIFDRDKDPIERLNPYIGDILVTLTSYIKETRTSQFFDLLLEIFITYKSSIKENEQLLFEILKAIVERAQVEYNLVKTDPQISKNTLIKVWNVIRSVAETEDFVLRAQDQIEPLLIPLIAPMETDDQLPYEEEILAYVASVIKTRRQVTDLLWKIFELFPKIFQKHQGMFWHLFSPLNYMIVYGKDHLNQNPEAVQTIVNMGIQGLNPTAPKSNSANLSEAALILQLCIHYLDVPQETWEPILLACLAKIKTIEKGFMKARLGSVFLVSFVKNFQFTQAVVAGQGEAEYLIDHILKNVISYETHPYDRKVFLIGLTHFFSQKDLVPAIEAKLPDILSLLIPVFKYVEVVEQIGVTKSDAIDADDDDLPHRSTDPEFLKDFLKDDFNPGNKDQNGAPTNLFNNANEDGNDDDKGLPDEYDNLEPEDLVIVLTAEEEANKVLDKFEMDFKKEDEFAYFRKVILDLRKNSPQVLELLYNSLPVHKQNFLKDILNSQRVLLDDQAGTSQARKIVKAKTRKIATIQFGQDGQGGQGNQ